MRTSLIVANRLAAQGIDVNNRSNIDADGYQNWGLGKIIKPYYCPLMAYSGSDAAGVLNF
jgi:hypothetical protein